MLDVSFAANSGVKGNQSADVLESSALLGLLKNMTDAELAALEDEINFAQFTGLFGPMLTDITSNSHNGKRHIVGPAESCAA